VLDVDDGLEQTLPHSDHAIARVAHARDRHLQVVLLHGAEGKQRRGGREGEARDRGGAPCLGETRPEQRAESRVAQREHEEGTLHPEYRQQQEAPDQRPEGGAQGVRKGERAGGLGVGRELVAQGGAQQREEEPRGEGHREDQRDGEGQHRATGRG
jgi:hypothetical protein